MQPYHKQVPQATAAHTGILHNLIPKVYWSSQH